MGEYFFWLGLVVVGLLGGFFAGESLVYMSACQSACSRRGTKMHVRSSPMCICADGTTLRADVGLMYKPVGGE